MATHTFPSPPDLSELFKFFAAPNGGPSGTRASPQRPPSSHPRNGIRESSNNRDRSTRRIPQHERARANRASIDIASKATATSHRMQHRRHESPPKEPTLTSSRANDWNGSTQIPVTTAKPLKHQILNRNYQPPAPVVVDASGATHLLQRLSKTTVSSRLKRHHADQAATLAAATAVLTGAFERRSQLHAQQYQAKTAAQSIGELSPSNDEDDSAGAELRSPLDSRARDGIQMLLMYRKEVEKRLSLDPTHFPSQ